MVDPETGRGLRAGAAVLVLAAMACVAGLLAPSGQLQVSVTQHQPEVELHAIDPQPDVVIRHLSFSLAGPADSSAVISLLARLGGPDPALRGLTIAEPGLDEQSLRRAIAGVPGAQVHGVMSVIVRGGQSTGIGVESATSDPTTGLITGREEVTILATVTVLEDGRLAVSARLTHQRDSSTLAVLSRRAGLALGESGNVADALVLEPGRSAVIRLPGSVLRVVLLTVGVREAELHPTPENRHR